MFRNYWNEKEKSFHFPGCSRLLNLAIVFFPVSGHFRFSTNIIGFQLDLWRLQLTQGRPGYLPQQPFHLRGLKKQRLTFSLSCICLVVYTRGSLLRLITEGPQLTKKCGPTMCLERGEPEILGNSTMDSCIPSPSDWSAAPTGCPSAWLILFRSSDKFCVFYVCESLY